MIANILVIEYEPRSVQLVRTALENTDYRLEIAGNLDEAVARCAQFEPTIVIITSVLPNLKIDDAITQLRARAGLRITPILILMSGYTGDDPTGDAERYGAEDILPRPFSGDDLSARVAKLVANAPSPAATQAIPREMLEALRKSAGLEGEEQQVTSDDLFGDILSDVEGGEQQPVTPPAGTAAPPPAKATTAQPKAPSPPAKPKAAPTPEPSPKPSPKTAPEEAPKTAPPKASGTDIDQALAEILKSSKAAPPEPAKTSDDKSVDKLLEETLSGLDVQPRAKAKPPSAAPPEPVKPPEQLRPSEPATTSAPPAATPPKLKQPKAPPARAAIRPPKPADEPPSKPAPSQSAPEPPPQPELPPVPPPAAKEPKPLPPEPDRPAVHGAEFGQYVIEEHVATGGMADVYKARMVGMEGFQKTVAIKRILSNLTDSDEFVRMFIDEAKLAAQLNHDNIIQIFDLGKVDRSHYIAMEYIEGRDLRSILQDCRDRKINMPIELALYIATLLASALDYAHKKQDFENRDLGLVHRDVSPQNVLISHDGNVKLCDFGIAKAASKASQTRAGALKGKLQYMSPEQAWGKDIDHRSDIFSLGLVLYEMLVSEKVFEGNSELSVLEQVRDPIIQAPSMKNPDVDPEIDRIVFSALNPDREQRCQSAQDLQRDLERVMRSKGWSPDRKMLSDFLRHLGHEAATAPSRPAAAAPAPKTDGAAAAPPSGPPPSRPAAPAPQSPSPADDSSADLLVENQELEKALTDAAAPPPVVGGYDLDASDAGVGRSATAGGGRKMLWIAAAAVVLLGAAGAGWWFLMGPGAGEPDQARSAPIAVVPPPETPTPEPTVGLMSEDELLERAREVAAAEIVRQEEELRQRLQEEFPTPTRIPPTWTPTETHTPVPSATATSTPPPPTATRVPPTRTPIPPTPTPVVVEGEIVEPGPDVTPPKYITRVPPKFPQRALTLQAQGQVEAQALIGIDGSVEEVRILSVSRKGVGFEDATRDAVLKWRFRPATKRGVKVRTWMTIRVPFELKK